MHFSSKKAYQKPTVGFSFFASCGKIVPAMRKIERWPASKRNAQKETKRTEIITSSLPLFPSVINNESFSNQSVGLPRSPVSGSDRFSGKICGAPLSSASIQMKAIVRGMIVRAMGRKLFSFIPLTIIPLTLRAFPCFTLHGSGCGFVALYPLRRCASVSSLSRGTPGLGRPCVSC
jgi:hypothetical protein